MDWLTKPRMRDENEFFSLLFSSLYSSFCLYLRDLLPFLPRHFLIPWTFSFFHSLVNLLLLLFSFHYYEIDVNHHASFLRELIYSKVINK